jgi:mannose-6-phosphate isomerase-like protein (cupin superfamily)
VSEGVLNGPGEGETLRNARGNRTTVVKAALPHVTVFEFTIEGPFDGPDPHTHDNETDSFYILEGELDVYIGGVWTVAGPGTMMAAPPGVEHGFTKREPGTVRFLNIHAPGGFEEEMRRVSVDPSS